MRGDRFRFWLLAVWSVVTALLMAGAYGCSAENRAGLGQDAGRTDATVDGASDARASDGSAVVDSQADVDAAPATFSVSGYVTGLRGSNLQLSFGTEDVAVTAADGGVVPFVFQARLPSGASYAVTVKTQPTSPMQSCAVTGGSGVIGSTDVNDVEVTCETVPFSVGGNVLGLRGSGLVLRNNGGNDLVVSGADAGAGDAGAPPPVPFTFTNKVESGASFNVSVFTPPSSPTQTCTIAGGQGTIVAGDVTTVTVNCITNTYTVGGTVTGLAGTGLKLKNNGGDEISVNASSFSFPSAVTSGEPYAITVSGQPTDPWQTCEVATGTGSGTVGGTNVDSIVVACTTNTYSIGGSISGLTGSGLKLKNNGGEEITVTQDGPFAFPTELPSGATYAVTVSADPTNPWQTCTVASPGGTVMGGDVKSVAVTCTTQPFTVGGNVTGAPGVGLKLTNNGANEIAIPIPGVFTFPGTTLSGQAYSVAISSRPSGAVCSLSGATGNVQGSAVTSVAVACAPGTVVGGTSFASTQQVPANTLLARPVTVASATVAHNLGGYWANAGCEVKYAIYSDASGVPGTLLGTTAPLTTTMTGASEIGLASPVSLAAGTYWIALLSFTACSGYYAPTGGPGYYATPGAYASPFPAAFGAGLAGGPGFDVSMFMRTLP